MRRAALVLAVIVAMFGASQFINSIVSSDPIYSSAPIRSSYPGDSKAPGLTATDRDVVAPDAQRSEATYLEQTTEQGGANASPALASESVARWISEAMGDDAAKRAAAIEALGTAPKSLAVPVLQKIVSAGADGDQQLALNSLRTLALDQGDADSIIRDTLRLTVYDGDDYVVADAQAVLEEIEHNLDGAVNGWR